MRGQVRLILGKRLSFALSLIDPVSVLCDVGTDHGKLPVAALLEGRAKRAIAIDISEKSLAKASLLAIEQGVSLDCRVGDGLSPLKGERTDCAVIAGMGAHEIVKILRERDCEIGKLVLIPHTHAPLLRAFLKEENVRIVRDAYVKESGKFYPVMQADLSLPWRDHSLYFGDGDMDGAEYAAARLKKIEELLSLKEDEELEEEREILRCVR